MRFCVNCGRRRVDDAVVAEVEVTDAPVASSEPVAVQRDDRDTPLQEISAKGDSGIAANEMATQHVPVVATEFLPAPPTAPVTHEPQTPTLTSQDEIEEPPASSSDGAGADARPPRSIKVNETDGVPTLAALPPAVRHGLGMGLRILGVTLAVGAVMSLLTIPLGADVSTGTRIRLLFSWPIQMSGLALFGTVKGNIEVGGTEFLSGTLIGVTPLWPLVAVLFFTARSVRSQARKAAVAGQKTSVRQIATEAGIASATAVVLLALLVTLAPVRASGGLGGAGMATDDDLFGLTQNFFAIEFAIQVGRLVVLGGMALFAVLFLVRASQEGELTALRAHPRAPLAGRVSAVLRDHFAFAYIMLLPAATFGLFALYLTAEPDPDASGGRGDVAGIAAVAALLWGPLMTVAQFLQAPVTLFGILPSVRSEVSAEVLGGAAGMDNDVSVPAFLVSILVVFGLLTIALVGLRWGLRQVEGWHAQWGTAWLLPAVYVVVSIPMMLLTKSTVNGSVSIPFVGGGDGAVSLQLPGYTVLLMGALGLGIEAIARVGTPWLESAMPGVTRLLSRGLERPNTVKPDPMGSTHDPA